jgi:hypothetical protein
MNHPDFERLVAYWLGEDDEVEEHYFACAQCAERLEWLAALSECVRATVRAGALGMVVLPPFVEAMKRAGMRVREYRVGAGETVNCTIRADDDAVLSYLRGSFAGVKRLDALQSVEVRGVAGPAVRLEDVPFDAGAGELVLVPSAAWLKTMPANTMRVRLVAVEESSERVVGEYTFAHTPS